MIDGYKLIYKASFVLRLSKLCALAASRNPAGTAGTGGHMQWQGLQAFELGNAWGHIGKNKDATPEASLITRNYFRGLGGVQNFV